MERVCVLSVILVSQILLKGRNKEQEYNKKSNHSSSRAFEVWGEVLKSTKKYKRKSVNLAKGQLRLV